MSNDVQEVGTFETRKDAGEGGPGTYKFWMTAIDTASKDEEKWRKAANDVNDRYRLEKNNSQGSKFNILYSSVQTQEPAMYNSTPIPDVRRRFSDSDPVGKVAAQCFERALSHCCDEYDYDAESEAVVHDSLTVGRGVGLVVYDPTMAEDGTVAYESTRWEHVQWDDFRKGPSKTWAKTPWVAVRYRITRDDAIKLNPTIGPKISLDYVEDKKADEKSVPDVFKRLTIWKIWDKTRREIIFIAPSYKEGAFAREPDTLQLEDFFPFPRPIYDVVDPNSTVPLIPFEQYRTQAEELDQLTVRIRKLVAVLKWRGIRPANITELDGLADADDGKLIPSESFDALMMAGQPADRAIWLMPIDKLILVIRELVAQREQVKQVVFEISGMADIMRGESDPNETLGAQQLKAQWGSMRMQRRQREVQRFMRDIMRIKAEIIGEQFDIETIKMITGLKLPTMEEKQQAQLLVQQMAGAQVEPPEEIATLAQAPAWEEVKAVMSSDQMRSYRVDIETDSTIQADVQRNQQNISAFIEGLAAFGQAVGPALESGDMPKDVAADMLTGFARSFKLGRQAEDAIERWGQEARKPKGPDPVEMARMQEEQQTAREQAQAQAAQAAADAKKSEESAFAAQRDAQQMELDRVKAEEDGIDRQAERELKREQMEFDRQKMALERDKMAVEVRRLEAEGIELDIDQGARNDANTALQTLMETVAAITQISQQQTEALAQAVGMLAQSAEMMAAASNAPRHVRLETGKDGKKVAISEVVH